MAYRLDAYDNALVIDGWDAGIARNPYEGPSDIRNVLTNSVPGEAAVNFAMGSISATVAAGTVTSVLTGGTNVVFAGAGGLENNMAITFGTVSNYSGITGGTTVYWVQNVNGVQAGSFSLSTNYVPSAPVTVSGSGNASFTVYAPNFTNYQGNTPKRFARSSQSGNIFLLDSKGLVWSNKRLTGTTSGWTYTGNIPASNGDQSNGNGIVFLQPTPAAGVALGNGYVFIFNDSSIDYCIDNAANTWNYGWNPSTATNNQAAGYLNSGKATGNSHDALIGQDNVCYYCDGNILGSFGEKSGQTFNPTVSSTFSNNTGATFALKLPSIETSTCLAELGIYLLVGGTRNLIYPWDRTSSSFTYPIWMTEYTAQRMVTVQNNVFILAGNRGRIHITDGTKAWVWQKVPDHLSGTVEPYYRWGDCVSNKNQLYFSLWATTNGDNLFNTPLSQYGGLWAVDLNTQALRLANQFSYATYGGFAPALFSNSPLYNGGLLIGNTAGSSVIAGWYDGVSTSGIDQGKSTPYTGSQAYVDSELIPIGTFEKPRNFTRIQYLLSKPMVAGESIQLQYRTDFSQSYTTIATDSTTGNFTNGFTVNFYNSQWVQFRAILNSTATNPSYVRLKQLRLTGFVGPTLANAQQITQ